MPDLTAEELAFKAEHDAIKSYEDGWDDWDGPQWPIGTVQCSIRMDNLIRTHISSNIPAEAEWRDYSPQQEATGILKDSSPMENDGRGSLDRTSP
jgi:hypothetical protein